MKISQSKTFSNSISKTNKRLNKQRGITTVQIAIGILVGVIALIGSFGGFQYIAQAKLNLDMNAMQDLKTATARYGSTLGTGGFTTTNVTTAQLNNLGFFAGSGFTVTTTPALSVLNQYGGAVSAAVGVVTGDVEDITFTFAGLPSTACRGLALRVDSIAAATAAANTAAGTVAPIKAIGGTTDPVAAATNCNGVGNINKLAVTFSRS